MKKKQKSAIIGIDIQNDFTNPKGALYMKGAEDDVRRMCKFIEEFGPNLDYLLLSMDTHEPIHVASQCYWKDAEGYPPALFSTITAADVEAGKWTPQHNKQHALGYLKKIEEKGDLCTIWPTHCLLGGWGWSIDEKIIKLLFSWSIGEGKNYDLLLKGKNQATEHYSIFKAAVEFPEDEDTHLNKKLLKKLENYDTIIIIGEAADYCVAHSVDDILNYMPHLANRIIITTDCMSWANPSNRRALEIYDKARNLGARFMTSDEILKLYEYNLEPVE